MTNICDGLICELFSYVISFLLDFTYLLLLHTTYTIFPLPASCGAKKTTAQVLQHPPLMWQYHN